MVAALDNAQCAAWMVALLQSIVMLTLVTGPLPSVAVPLAKLLLALLLLRGNARARAGARQGAAETRHGDRSACGCLRRQRSMGCSSWRFSSSSSNRSSRSSRSNT